MEQFNLLKKTLPTIVKQFAGWFEVDVTIKLFGVKVFSFTWPPKIDIVEPKDDLPC